MSTRVSTCRVVVEVYQMLQAIIKYNHCSLYVPTTSTKAVRSARHEIHYSTLVRFLLAIQKMNRLMYAL